MNPLTYMIVNGAIIVLIYIGAMRVNIGDLTQGQVVALLNYMSQILIELVKLANLIISVKRQLPAETGSKAFLMKNHPWKVENFCGMMVSMWITRLFRQWNLIMYP